MRIVRILSVVLGSAASVVLLSNAAQAAQVHPLGLFSDRRFKHLLGTVTNAS